LREHANILVFSKTREQPARDTIDKRLNYLENSLYGANLQAIMEKEDEVEDVDEDGDVNAWTSNKVTDL
jgi:hypothetical protein